MVETVVGPEIDSSVGVFEFLSNETGKSSFLGDLFSLFVIGFSTESLFEGFLVPSRVDKDCRTKGEALVLALLSGLEHQLPLPFGTASKLLHVVANHQRSCGAPEARPEDEHRDIDAGFG